MRAGLSLWPLLLGAAFCVAGPACGEMPLAASAGIEAELGRALFEKLWVPAPTATRASDGLGPAFNARACANCHPDAGRGTFEFGLVAKLSQGAGAGPLPPDPVLGAQLQTRAVAGLAPEGVLQITRADGVLRADITGAAPDPARRIALRFAPPLIASGQIEALPEAQIRARHDPDDRDQDGISGRAAEAYSPDLGRMALARFGWKAEAATLQDQSAKAFHDDLGLSTPLYPDPYGDCRTPACRALPNGEDAGLREGREVGAEALGAVALYLRALRPEIAPISGAGAPDIAQRGATLFASAGCAACHANAPLFSDLLLHDMGAALADDHIRAQTPPNPAQATAAEWRTAPLYGLSLSKHGPFLHDGRAQTLDQAIDAHGGEAVSARDKVRAAPAADQAALIAYLESL